MSVLPEKSRYFDSWGASAPLAHPARTPMLITRISHLIFGLVLVRPSLEIIRSFAILTTRKDPLRNIRLLITFRVDLPRTVCQSVCLKGENVARHHWLTHFFFLFSIAFFIIERRLSPYWRVCDITHCT